MGKIIGIDLGTTNTVVATLDIGGSRVLQNSENDYITRSAVALHKGNLLVGRAAINCWPLVPKDTIISVKRLMGRSVVDPDVEKAKKTVLYKIVEPSDGTKDSIRVLLGGKEYSPVDISAEILKKVKRDAEAVLGGEVTHAVITVPAYFSDKQRNATREAGLRAGLTVMKILDEPTAAAIAFGIDARSNDAKTVLVYDLGGGTFDISVLMMSAGAFATLNLEGDMWLGGDNFDQIIVDYAVGRIKSEFGVDAAKDDRFMVILKIEAQKAKELLSNARAASIIIPGVLHDKTGELIDIDIDISREYFEESARPLIERTVQLTRKAVENAHLELGDVDCVIMAGNATSMPAVRQAMAGLFGKEKVLLRIHPKYSVAIGAAMAAAIYGAVNCPKCGHDNSNIEADRCEKCGAALMVAELKRCPSCGFQNGADADKCSKCGSPFISVIPNVAPFSYGIQTMGDKFNVFINKSNEYETPAEKRTVKSFYTHSPNQRIVSLPVFGGDDAGKASNNVKQGEAMVILPPKCPAGTEILLKLWLDRDGAFQLSATLGDKERTPLKPCILRGESDQKAVEMMQQGFETLRAKDEGIPPDAKKQADTLLEDALQRFEEGNMPEAQRQAQRLLDHIAQAQDHAQGSVIENAENMAEIARYIVSEYGWLLAAKAYAINNLIGQIEEEIRNNNRVRIESKTKELNDKLNKLLVEDDGETPSMFGVLYYIRSRINSSVKQSDPVKAAELLRELDAVEEALRKGQPNAQGRLHALYVKLNGIIEKLPDKSAKCHQCGHKNNEGALTCANCGADLRQLVNQRNFLTGQTF